MVRHHVKLIIDSKDRKEKDILDAIDDKFGEHKENMKQQMKECYNNLIEVVKETEDKSNAGDSALREEIKIIKSGILSMEGAYFKQSCRKALEPDHYITSHEFEEITIDHGVYNSLGGNHEGDQLFKLVEAKIKNQIFKEEEEK